MSSPRVQKIFEGLPEQLRRMGYANAMAKNGIPTCLVWSGRNAAGNDTVVLDLDSATWTTGNRRAIIEAIPAGTSPTDYADFHTQSHASGHYIDGSVSLKVYMEANVGTSADAAAALASLVNAQSKFGRELLHILRGQEGAPFDLLLTANAVEPTVDGANGASSTAATSDAGYYMPYGMTYPGGV